MAKLSLRLWGPNDEEGGVRLVSIAGEFKNRRLPLNVNLYNEIIKNSFASYYYAINYLDPKNTPVELIKSLAKNPEFGMSYAVDILKGKNVPNVILDKIQEDSMNVSSDPHRCNIGNYVQKLMAKKYPIQPPWYLEVVKDEQDMQVQFYYSWKEALDHGLVDRIPDEAYELISKQAAIKIYQLGNLKERHNFDPKIVKMIDTSDIERWEKQISDLHGAGGGFKSL
jgi:hypothetical protein